MKNKNQMKPLARLIATSLAVGSLAGFGAQAFAATAAGTLIKNLATVTYQDENGNEYSAQSNEAVVTVAPVASATVEADKSLSAAPGQTVYFPHVISNTGNVADSYSFGVTDTSIAGGGTLAATSLEVYHDLNGNGQPDPGEPILTTESISVAAGEVMNVVVALGVPTTAVANDKFSAKLLTTAASGVTVDDIGANVDATEGTVDDVANVTTGAILVVNKSSVHNEANSQITYTLTVRNNGATDATNVQIIDALPQADTNASGSINAGDTQMALVGVPQVNGLLISNSDSVPAGTVSSIASYGDVNHNGDTTDDVGLNVIFAQDAALPANTTVTIVYTVSYDPSVINPSAIDPELWEAGSVLENTFKVEADSIDPISSNTTSDVVPQVYDVVADDTDLNTAAVAGTDDASNDGKDDDNTDDDIQTVDVAASGAFVLFKHTVENTGNGDDIFNVNTDIGSFPPGTVFSYWDETGNVQLTDTDDDGQPDTGVLSSYSTTTIMVKAKLPAGYTDAPIGGGSSYDATLTATSAGDSSESDPTTLRLGKITEPSVDLVTEYVSGDAAGQGFALVDGFRDAGAVNAQTNDPVLVKTGDLGEKVIFALNLANESGSSDSYTLGASNVPTGWSVVFKDLNGNVITTSSLVPGGGEFKYTAEVTISDDPSEALHDAGTGVDGYDAVNDATSLLTGGDLDDDYQLDFTVTSTSKSSLADTVTNAVDVELKREVVITPNGQNQIQPGGTVDYSHKLENNGNQTEPVELEVDNTETGWTTIINVDTNNDGTPDTVLIAPAMGSTFNISGVDDEGNIVVVEVTDVDGDGKPELNLEPGENVNFTTTVSAPSNAPLGAVDQSSITATEPGNDTPLSAAEDQTSVIVGQVRLEKTAAIDVDCEAAGAPTAFFAEPPTEVKPGECIVWNLTATNEGSTTVKNVVISDAVPDFTEIVDDELKFCHGNGCVPAGVTDSSNADQGTYANGLIQFFAGNAGDAAPADPINGKGGELIAGEQATGQFMVKVQ